MALEDSLVRLQAVVRGHSVRSKLNDAKTQFLEIVHDIEEETSQICWKGNGILAKPMFSDRPVEPANQQEAKGTLTNQLAENSEEDESRSSTSNRTRNSMDDTKNEMEESDRVSVRNVACGTDYRDVNADILTEVLPLKHVEDVGCQTSLTDDASDVMLDTSETQCDNDPMKGTDERHVDINRSLSRDCILSETSSISSSEQLESPHVPMVADNTVSPVTVTIAESSALPSQQQTFAPAESHQVPVVHAQHTDTEPELCQRDTQTGPLDDSSLFDVTQLSSTWPSVDSEDIDLTEDRATLVKKHEELALELVWIRQAIESRKQYLTIKSRLDVEDAIRSGMQQRASASDS